jgi:hypothetical protein
MQRLVTSTLLEPIEDATIVTSTLLEPMKDTTISYRYLHEKLYIGGFKNMIK